MRPGDGADDVEGVLDVGHPVAHRLVERVLERAAAGLHRNHLGAQKLHAIDVLGLAHDVFAAHVDHALHAVARRDRGGSHPVLARAGFGDHARLAHAPGQQRLADGVVDLVGAGVVEILALEIDLGAAQHRRPAPRVVDGRGPADEVGEFVAELGHELGVDAIVFIRGPQFLERMHERFGDENATVWAEVSAGVGKVVGIHARWGVGG
jgi:hypothetical protein